MGSRTSTISQKYMTVINFTQSRVSIDFSCTVSKIQNTRHSQRMGSLRARFREIMCRSQTLHKVASEVKFRSIFHAPSQKFKIFAIRNVLAHGKSYEHDFMKKRNGYKLCAESCSKSSFNWFFMYHLGNSK
ncbi:hypothetical protein B296_00020365 [Ensete ventricosum]|uniref:Uncharacterized protein n=1 Tax=Ensete ventricosum TaxID=4639 RepID=A0A427AA48_ENSVE|nr:hypothetical protein B296_00020365 [Ensete ventricosum]